MAWLTKAKRLNPKTKTKAIYWSIQWRDEDGRKRMRGLGFITSDEARKHLKIFEGRQALGEPVEPPAPTPTAPGSPAPPVMPTLRSYLTDTLLPAIKRDKAPKTHAFYQTAANALNAHLGDLLLTEVNFRAIDAYVTARKAAGRRTRTIIIELRCLKVALQHAYDSEIIGAIPKFPVVKDRDKRPPRFLTAEETKRLLEAVRPLEEQPHTVTRGKPPITRDRLSYLVILMALNTGMRKNEMLTRGWEDIRWDEGPHGSIFVGAKPEVDFQVKTRRERVVPLTPELRRELEAAWKEAGQPRRGWIFPSRNDPKKPRQSFITALRLACKRAGLPYIHPHGLRHTWASRLAMSGVDRRTLMEIGGWQNSRMLDEIYTHVPEAHKAAVMSKFGIE